MAKSKKNGKQKAASTPAPTKSAEPILSHGAFLASMVVMAVGLVSQIVMAFMVYHSLPAQIPSGWMGWTPVGGEIPSWYVFIAFPGAMAALLIFGVFSPKDKDGRQLMDWSKSFSLIALAALFVALQASSFRLR